ncbi:hypothetical protein PR048_030385 [Dryococelus australis]|uniref:MIF4G domain-containing protein n=1 Tax=Dryococelus australis TaxID=614101 RepID=A0ABQ9GCQ9_9NEOP|nr:hypothetical protein PR048_030385 [Dryococelus australis]
MECEDNSFEIDTWQYLSEQIAETENRLSRISTLREVNLNASNVRPDEKYFLTLDSTLKKNSAFVRKLKSFCARQLASLLQEMNTLNLTKYLGEVAGAIVESKIKMRDIPSASRFCSVMHQHYSKFSDHLLESWTRIFSADSSKWYQNETKMKINILLYSEMILTGVLTSEESFALLESVLETIIKPDMEEHVNVSIIMTFCKHCGYDFAGLIPRSMQHLAIIYNKPIPTSSIIRKENQRYIRALLKEYHVTLCKHLLRLHRELLRVVREEKRIYKLKGEVDVERKKEANELLLSFQDVHKNCMELGEYLSEDSPLFLHDELSWIEEIKLEDEEEFSSELWEDEESQHFYEHFPNIKDIAASFPLHSPKYHNGKPEKEDYASKYHNEKPEEKNHEVFDMEETLFPRNINIKVQFKVFLENLPKCVNRELIDNSSVNFAMSYNTKWNRKQLVQSLLTAPRTRIDLLPFYARMVATLNPTMPDIAKDLEALLLKEFRYLCRNKCQLNIESKLKVVIFMGELVKFRVFPAAEALGCLKWLLFNFSHPHHIEMFCGLMDTCGKFLFRQPEYHQRVKIYLEDMMRKKAACTLDPRYSTTMENTFFQVNPPERQPSTQKNRPIMHEFIRKLLYKDLSRNCSESIVKSMRRLDWRNRDVADYAVKCLTNATNVKYHNIRYLAEVVCGLSYYHKLAGTQPVPLPPTHTFLSSVVSHPVCPSSLLFASCYCLDSLGTADMNMDKYKNSEMTDMDLVYGEARGNGKAAAHVYSQIYPALHQPNHHTFTHLTQRLRETCTFQCRCGRGRSETICTPQFAEAVLENVADNASTSTRVQYGVFSMNSYCDHSIAPLHFTRIVCDHRNTASPARWIVWGGPRAWSPHSSDLTPLYFWLWGLLKACENETPMASEEDLLRRLGMELNNAEHNQSRLTMVKYLGELHNYYLVETNEVLNVLYSFITFGVDGLDPLPGLFRVRLACMLLNTAGPYMGADGQLDVFLAFLQDFFWSVGGHSPLATVMHLLQDTLQVLRPDLRIAGCPEEARAAMRDRWQELVRCYRGQVLDSISEQDDQDTMPQRTADDRPCENVEDKTEEPPRESKREDLNSLRDEEHMTDETPPPYRKSSTDGKSPVEQNITTDNKYPTDRKIQMDGKLKSKMFEQNHYYEMPSTNRYHQADEQCPTSQSTTDNHSCNEGAPPHNVRGDGDILTKAHLVDEKPTMCRKSITEGKTPMVHKIAMDNKYPKNRNGQMHGKFKSQMIQENYDYGRYFMYDRNGQMQGKFKSPMIHRNYDNGKYYMYDRNGQMQGKFKSPMITKDYNYGRDFKYGRYQVDSSKRSSPMVSCMSSTKDVNQKRDSCVSVGNTSCGSTEPVKHPKDEPAKHPKDEPAKHPKYEKKKTTRNMLSVLDHLQSQLEKMEQLDSQKNTNN